MKTRLHGSLDDNLACETFRPYALNQVRLPCNFSYNILIDETLALSFHVTYVNSIDKFKPNDSDDPDDADHTNLV